MATTTVLQSPSSLHDGEYYPTSLRAKYRLQSEAAAPNPPKGSEASSIGWIPDFEQYQTRSAARLRAGGLKQHLPNGWPSRIVKPSCWTGNQFQDESVYTHTLDSQQISEIEAAVQNFKGLGLPMSEVCKASFPLPSLQQVLVGLCEDLHHGKGFCVLRGLDPKRYTEEENALIFLGVSSYFGEQRGRQVSQGNIFTHILNVNNSEVPPEKRAALFNNYDQPFHNDVICAIVGMQVFGCAAKGGSNILAPSHTVYNEIAATRPDLIHTLSENWALDTFGRRPAYHKRPLMYNHDGNVILNFSRRNLTGSYHAPRTKGIPLMTEAQADALDTVHFLAEKHQLKMTMAPGDLRFFNNLFLLHRRDVFENDSSHSRHVMRVWLCNEELMWNLPGPLQLAMDRCFAENEDLSEKDYSYHPQEILKVPMLKTKMTCT